ncbi:MAG TPA: hypothetical protein VFT66_24655 [Roseiflexaceae bacterium]|jgi:hypothetical protein|nr:hypothetical protein [Roseiflexaceae bacterium]
MRRLPFVLVTLLLMVVGITPGQARAQGSELPKLAPFTTMRDTFIQTFNGQPLQVCQSEWESWNRVHGTCHDLVTATTTDQVLTAGMVVEFVFYDGVHFQRVNDETTWTASRDEQYDPDLTFEEAFFKISYNASLTQIGPDEVGNMPVTHYQYWSLDETLNKNVGGQAIYDLFLSNENRVLSDVFSARGSIPGLGDGTLAQTWVYSDFNAPIVVAPPPFERVQFTSK